MIEENFRELVHEEIDGTATPQGSMRLREHLARDPEARAYFQEAQRLGRILGSVEMVEPPPDLKATVLRAIRPLVRESPEGESWWTRWARPFQLLAGLRPATAFAGGIAVGALALVLISGSPQGTLDPTSLTGTLLRGSAVGGAPIERLAIDVGGITGTATTRASNEAILADIHLRSPRRVLLEVQFDPGTFSGIAFGGGPGEVTKSPAVAWADGRLRLSHEGDRSFLLVLRRRGEAESSPPLHLKLIADGKVVLDRKLQTTRNPSGG